MCKSVDVLQLQQAGIKPEDLAPLGPPLYPLNLTVVTLMQAVSSTSQSVVGEGGGSNGHVREKANQQEPEAKHSLSN